MPSALSIGIPYDTFWHLNPKKLKAFYKAEELKQKKIDGYMHLMGQYVLCAISSCFNGKYPEKPFLSSEEKKEETEEDMIKKAIIAEEQWISAGKAKGLPKTVIKKEER